MNGYSIINKKPSIVCLNQRLITKLGANYYSIRKIEMVEKIINSTEDNKALGSLVKTKEKRMKPKGKDSIYIGLANINSDTGEIEVNTVDEANIEGTSVIIEAGDILFSKLRPNLNKVAICPKYIGNALGSTEFVVMESKIIDKYFLYSVLKSNVALKQVIDITTGSILPRIDSEDVLNILIPIPSPEIQNYIGDKVRRAEELREEAKRLENDINTFFNEKFSDIYKSIDESKVYHSKFTWKSAENIRDVFNAEYFTLVGDKYEQVIRKQKGVYLDDLLKDCFMGKSPSQYADKGPKILKVKNLTNGGLDWSDSDHVDKEFYVKNERCHLQHGDVFIIPAAHLAKYIGEKVDVYIQGIEGIKYPDAMASGKIIVIRPNFDKVNPIYLCLVMREKFVYHQIQRQVSGITASYYPKDVRQLCIPLIEREKQDMVADKYIEIIKCKEQAKQLIQEAKQDVEDLIEGKFDMSKLNKDSGTESRC
ncbi:restriction endonuclease subunit S [Desulfofalx alkaliphila]|jgi:type I restriction enzyme S subunit|uniref:restriction endonuclease subunit S n=1 Tax=Desulfofalx alkaliphila TaxID=105483 RepID=UPI0004E1DF36|nr:restriction endonuclease subunit S [Desulfofalx alkaliphila]